MFCRKMGYGELGYWKNMGIGGKWGNIGKSWIVLRESGNLLEKLGKTWY